MTTWQTLLLAFGGEVGLLATLAYLLNKIISHRLLHEAETFKTNLQAQANLEIERLKSSLQIAAAEHQVRFSKLHEKRGEVIEKLYELLLQAKDATALIAAHPNDEGCKKQTFDQHLELYRFFHLNKIYLPSALCRLLNDYEVKVRNSAAFINIYMRIEDPSPGIIQEQNKVLMDAWHALDKELPFMLAGLEKEFRVLLGVESK